MPSQKFSIYVLRHRTDFYPRTKELGTTSLCKVSALVMTDFKVFILPEIYHFVTFILSSRALLVSTDIAHKPGSLVGP